MAYELIRFASTQELVQVVADDWLTLLRSAPKSGFVVALSGGRVAQVLFEAVAGRPEAAELQAKVDFFWADERCVPPGEPQSNFALALERLFAPLGIPESRIHRVRGELEPAFAAQEAESALRRCAPRLKDNQPVLDLVLLGMGEDGHVASLFPGEPAEAVDSQAVYRSVVGPKPPPRRITLGYPAIAAASRVWVVASGQGKEDALRRSLQPEDSTPLARVLAMRQGTRIYTDLKIA